MSEKADIDFVILWVDDQDPIWIEDKNKYKGQQGNHTNNEVRYRDWQNLKYWFRAVEKYAPWVRKIHFVTCGQKPEWLNINHPKTICINDSSKISNFEKTKSEVLRAFEKKFPQKSNYEL